MKLRYTIFVLLVVLLTGSLINTGSVIAQTTPNTNFETGDNFQYKSTETRLNYWQNRFVMSNDANTSQLYRYDEQYNENNENSEGDLDLFLVKPGINLPAFTSPEGDFDHLLIVDWSGMTVDPSNRTGWTKFYDAGAQPAPQWDNQTHPTENTAGRYYSNDDNNGDDGDDRTMPVVSNATYLIQMSELTENTYYFDELNQMGPMSNQDFGTFNPDIPLFDRLVSTELGTPYTINGIGQNIDTRIARSTFKTSFNELFNTSISLSDPNDPNPSFIDMEADVTIFVEYMFEYYFDMTTGMLLEIREDRDYSVDILYYNANTTNVGSDPGCTVDCGPATMAFEWAMSFGGNQSVAHVIDSASSFYGNTRPVSDGANRIEQGDLLVYDSESSNEFSIDSDMVVGDSSTTGWENFDSKWGYSDGYGTVNFDVYRHQPGSFDTVMFMEGTSNGEWGYDNSGTHQGQYRSDSNTSTWGPENYLDYDYMSFMSSADEEIIHFFDENMNFDDDFLYDDKDNGDGWRLNYNRDVSQSGVVNDTAFHADLSSDEIFQINGFDRTWFDVQMYGQNYERTYNEVVEIPVFRDENGEAWMNVTLTGMAEGSQEFFYDANTGVLLRMEQRTNVYLTLDGNQFITFDVFEEGKEPATITVAADFFASITISEKFSIMLNEHPVEYLTAETTDPIDHVTDTSTSTTTTVDTITSSSTTTSDDGGNGADLPLPVSIVPVLSALTVVAIYVRKRKY